MHVHHPTKFQLPTPSSSKVIAKSIHFWLISRPLLRFLSRPLYCAKYLVIRVCHCMSEREITRTHFLSRPSYEHCYSFQQLHLGAKCKIWFISRPLILVSLQHNGRWTASISAPQVQLECRGPATCIWRVERPNLALALEASSIKRDIWFMTIVGYLGKEGFRWWSILPISKDANAKKDPGCSFSGHHRYTRSVDLLLEPHWWDVQRHQARWGWVDRQTWPTWIKNLVEKCQYVEAEKLVLRTELLFHAWPSTLR